jgi:AraC-like DNA-binding protein
MPEKFELFAAAMRFASIGILAAASVTLLRSARGNWASRFTIMFAIGVCGYLLDASSSLWQMFGVWLPLLELISAAVPLLLWLVTRAILVDGFRPKSSHWLALALFSLLGASTHHLECSPEISARAFWLYSFARLAILSATILRVARSWRTRPNDIRHQSRNRFAFVTVVTSIFIVLIEFVGMYFLEPKVLEAVNAGIVLLIAMTITPSLHQMKLGDSGSYKNGAIHGAAAKNQPGQTSDVDDAILAAIRQEMETNHRFRDPQLCVASFAKEVGLPEYRLRQIINGTLGFGNFNGFVNHYRVAWIKGALADTRHARLPILTIAMDAGFASIAPFNKAFKEMTGETPSAYRKRMLGNKRKFENPMDNENSGGLIVALYDRFSEYLIDNKIEETERANTHIS